jgi:hypothetical protein
VISSTAAAGVEAFVASAALASSIARKPGIAPSCPKKTRSPRRTSWSPRPWPSVHASGSSMICTWCIASSEARWLAPAAQVGRSAPQASDRLDPVPLERRLRTERPRVGIDVVAAGGRLDRLPGRAGEAERPDETLVDEVGERRVGEPGDALAEQRICEVRVVPPFPGRQDELGIGQAGDELVALRNSSVSQTSPGGSRWIPELWASRRRSVRSPKRASGRCPTIGSSRSSFPWSRRSSTAAAVNVFVIEPIRYCVSGVGSRPLFVGDADRLCPDGLVAAVHSGGDAGQAESGLPTLEGLRQLRRGQGLRVPSESARSPGRRRRR